MRKKYRHLDRIELFSNQKIDVDFINSLFSQYSGEIIKFAKFNQMEGYDQYILLTKQQTVNKNITLVNVYWRNQRVFGVRVDKENLTLYFMNDVINRLYMDYVNE